MELLGAIVSGYKSLDQVEVPLGGLTVLFGQNGAGKSNTIEALGAHDPLAREVLRRTGGMQAHDRARVGLVTRFSVSADGTGPDAPLLLEMLAAPWLAGMSPRDITEGIGAYCGSCWWLEGGDLYSEEDRVTLAAAYAVVRRALLAQVEPNATADATRLLDLLLDDPILIVQEDFAVELSFDRATPRGVEIVRLATVIGDRADGVFGHLLGPLRSWTGEWPPLMTMTRGPGAQPSDDDVVVPVGFGWLVEHLGGVRVVSGDIQALEASLDRAIETAHDVLWHRSIYGGDEFCENCIRTDHGGRVDPSGDPHLARHVPRATWIERSGDWSRVRPSLTAAVGVVEEETNRQLPSFVAEQGTVRLRIANPGDWAGRDTRCELMFDVAARDAASLTPEWGGPVGVIGFVDHARTDPLTVAVADLGAGLRRWVATSVRLALDACISGDVSVVLGTDVDLGTEPDDLLPDDAAVAEVVAVLRSGLVQPHVLLIDEPEQHLHPHAQRVIAGWSAEQARHHRAVVVATHSPAFLALPPERATICEVRRIGHRTQIRPLRDVHGPDMLAQSRRLGFELGLGHDALAQLTRAVAVVEGDWDRRLLYHYFGPELAEQRVLVAVLQGSDELGGLADAAVIPALGVPVIALLDEVRATSADDLSKLTDPLSKAERALRGLAVELGDTLRVVRYEDPDVICALSESAVRAAYPTADFPGWTELLGEWEAAHRGEPERIPFKKWALKRMGLPNRDRMPARFFHVVIEHDLSRTPSPRFASAVKQLLSACV